MREKERERRCEKTRGKRNGKIKEERGDGENNGQCRQLDRQTKQTERKRDTHKER